MIPWEQNALMTTACLSLFVGILVSLIRLIRLTSTHIAVAFSLVRVQTP